MRFVMWIAVNLGAAAIGLAAAMLVLADRGFEVEIIGFIMIAVIFALLQGILAPLILQMAIKAAPPLVGGIGILSTVVALWITSLIVGDNLTTGGLVNLFLAALIIWIVSAIATIVLRKTLVKKAVGGSA